MLYLDIPMTILNSIPDLNVENIKENNQDCNANISSHGS